MIKERNNFINNNGKRGYMNKQSIKPCTDQHPNNIKAKKNSEN